MQTNNKLREALEALNRIDTRGLKRLLCELVESDIFDGGQINKTISAVDKAKAALAAPLRNCDRFKTAAEAAHKREHGNAAKLREALVQAELFVGNIVRHGHQTLVPGDKCTACDGAEELRDMICAALAAPATAEKSSAVGDAAKLREACANIAEYARSAICHATDAHLLGYLNQIEGWSKAALAAPPRNCDKYENAKDAWFAFDALQSKKGAKWHWTEYADWLFAPAQEGVAK